MEYVIRDYIGILFSYSLLTTSKFSRGEVSAQVQYGQSPVGVTSCPRTDGRPWVAHEFCDIRQSQLGSDLAKQTRRNGSAQHTQLTGSEGISWPKHEQGLDISGKLLSVFS